MASWPVCFSYPVGYTGIVWPLASLAGRARQRASPRPGQPVSLNLPESSASLLVETSPPPPGSVLQSSLLAGVVCAFTRPCRHSSRASKCGMLAPALTVYGQLGQTLPRSFPRQWNKCILSPAGMRIPILLHPQHDTGSSVFLISHSGKLFVRSHCGIKFSFF